MGSYFSSSRAQPSQPRQFDPAHPFDVYAVCFKKDGKITIVDALYDKQATADAHIKALKAKPQYGDTEMTVETISGPKSLDEIREKLGLAQNDSIAQTPGLAPHVWTILGPIV